MRLITHTYSTWPARYTLPSSFGVHQIYVMEDTLAAVFVYQVLLVILVRRQRAHESSTWSDIVRWVLVWTIAIIFIIVVVMIYIYGRWLCRWLLLRCQTWLLHSLLLCRVLAIGVLQGKVRIECWQIRIQCAHPCQQCHQCSGRQACKESLPLRTMLAVSTLSFSISPQLLEHFLPQQNV